MGKKAKDNINEIELQTANRVDYMPLESEGPDGDYLVEKMQDTPEGYLRGRAIATNVGVFPYLLEDGSVQYELRPPEEVFENDSVKSLEHQVITNNHPKFGVSAENVQGLQVGFTGDVRQDQYHLAPKLTITNKDAIENVKNGKRALSAGYRCDLDYTPGNWLGINYDAIQRNIKYNHLAIVDRGRAGDAVVMKLDAADNVGVMQEIKKDSLPSEKQDDKNKKIGASSMKITVDGVEYTVDNAEFVRLYKDTAKELELVKEDHALELEKAKADLATEQAKADQLKEDNEKLKSDMDELSKKDNSAEIDKAVQTKLDLLHSAEKAEVEVKEDMSDEDIKKAVVLKIYPNAEAKLDGCDSTYLSARYDGAMESIESKSGNAAFVGDAKSETKKDTLDETPKERTAEQARQDMIDNLKKNSQGKEA